MPTPGFAKHLTAIFNNSRLRETLKYDMVCRLVGESLRSATVSVLLYDARYDMLICKGSFLATKEYSNFHINSNHILEEIIENIVILDYFDSYNHENFDNFNFEEFIDFENESKLNYENLENKFYYLKHKWTDKSFRKVYNKYKETIHSEQHNIDDQSTTGSYYNKLLKFGNKLTNDVEIKRMNTVPQYGKKYFDIWNDLGIHIPKDELYYIGLPLFANERYTGVLRISTFEQRKAGIDDIFLKNKAFTNDSAELEMRKKISIQIEYLNHFAQLISLHIKTEFYLAGYRILNNLKIDINNNYGVEKKEANQVCDVLTKVLNCYGCIIRFDENEISTNPPIKGISENLKDYVSYVKNYYKPDFSEDIANIFRSVKYNNFKVKAINFSIKNDTDRYDFLTTEYYYEKDEDTDFESKSVLRFESNIPRRFEDFTSEYVKKIYDLKMREIVVLPLEFTKNGYLILSNTTNRKFTSSDIEMLLLSAKRIGLEIKYLQDRQKIIEQNKIIAHEENSKIIVHQIYAPIITLGGHLYNLVQKNIDPELISDRLERAYQSYNTAQRQLNTVQKYLEWETNGIKPKINQIRLMETLIAKANQFTYLAADKNLKIWVFKENDSDDNIFNTDINLFYEILNCLLDNAIKYSFTKTNMLRYNVPIDFENPITEGHIHIKMSNKLNKLVLTINNYGCTIRDDEKEKIFRKGGRGDNAKKFSQIGQGIGLYLINKIVSSLSGSIEGSSVQYKTTFKILLPNKSTNEKTNPNN